MRLFGMSHPARAVVSQQAEAGIDIGNDGEQPRVAFHTYVARRFERVVAAVGDRSRVIAGVDCGFGTFTGWNIVAAGVAWAKLRALNEVLPAQFMFSS